MKKILIVVSIVLAMAVAAMIAAEHIVVIRTEYQEVGRKTSVFGGGVVTIKAEKTESKLDGTIVSKQDLGECNIDIDGEFIAFYANKEYSSEKVEYEWR